MPKLKRTYIYCVRCATPLEAPVARQVDLGTMFVDFSACEECRQHLLAQTTPSVTFVIDGDTLKELLKSESSKCLVNLPEQAE